MVFLYSGKSIIRVWYKMVSLVVVTCFAIVENIYVAITNTSRHFVLLSAIYSLYASFLKYNTPFTVSLVSTFSVKFGANFYSISNDVIRRKIKSKKKPKHIPQIRPLFICYWQANFYRGKFNFNLKAFSMRIQQPETYSIVFVFGLETINDDSPPIYIILVMRRLSNYTYISTLSSLQRACCQHFSFNFARIRLH